MTYLYNWTVSPKNDTKCINSQQYIEKLMLLICLELGPWDIKTIWKSWNILDSGISLYPYLVPVPNPYPLTSLSISAPACASGSSFITWTLGLSFWWWLTFPVYYHHRAWEIISEKIWSWTKTRLHLENGLFSSWIAQGCKITLCRKKQCQFMS